MKNLLLSIIVFSCFVLLGFSAIADTFGYDDNTDNTYQSCENTILGDWFTMGVDDGTGDNISVKLEVTEAAHDAKCIIYDNDLTPVTNGITETKSIPVCAATWYTFNFTGTKPSLNASGIYFIGVWGNSTDGQIRIRRNWDAVINHSYDAGETFGNPAPSPFANTTFANSKVQIYCSYTVGAGIVNSVPVQSGESPTNGSIGVGVSPSCFVLLTDADGDDMNATWHTNASGQWIQFASNSSVGNNTNITQSYQNFKGYNTTYWWSVNVSDGEDGWTNETYSFTTDIAPSGGITRISRGAIWYLAIIAGFLAMAGFFIIRRKPDGKS